MSEPIPIDRPRPYQKAPNLRGPTFNPVEQDSYDKNMLDDLARSGLTPEDMSSDAAKEVLAKVKEGGLG